MLTLLYSSTAVDRADYTCPTRQHATAVDFTLQRVDREQALALSYEYYLRYE